MPEGAGYPRPGQGRTKGDSAEVECPSCGLANDISDEDPRRGDEFVCAHCDERFVVESVAVTVTVADVSARGR